MESMRISLLSENIQEAIARDLRQLGLDNEDIEIAMSSRLCDLEDTIDIDKYLQMIELERFYESALKVVELDLNLDSDLYPFEESFDEVVLKIKRWIQDVIENN